jgi:hypothetical protein
MSRQRTKEEYEQDKRDAVYNAVEFFGNAVKAIIVIVIVSIIFFVGVMSSI